MRRASRLVLVDDRERVLLFKYEDAAPLDPTKPQLTIYWATIGGGLEAGESFEQAAARELWEETGIRDAQIGPWIWTRERAFHFSDETMLAHEHYFLARVPATTISLTNLESLERSTYRAHHWWALDELRRSDEVFLPDGFPDLFAALLAGKVPAAPLIIS